MVAAGKSLSFSFSLVAAFGPFDPGAFIILQPFFHNRIDRAAIQVNLADHVADGIIINLKITHRLISTRPFFLAVFPADLFYPAAGLAAIIGLPFVSSPAWIMIAFFRVSRKLDPFTLELDRCPVWGVNPA